MGTTCNHKYSLTRRDDVGARTQSAPEHVSEPLPEVVIQACVEDGVEGAVEEGHVGDRVLQVVDKVRGLVKRRKNNILLPLFRALSHIQWAAIRKATDPNIRHVIGRDGHLIQSHA